MGIDLFNDWIEVFKAGTHTAKNGSTRTWDRDDIDEIIRNYNPIEREAPVVIGHPKDNDPAYGWVEKLKRSGSVLLAKFKQVDPNFAEIVKAGRYKKRSISLIGNRLRHVGFLGAVQPAVPGLADLSFGDEILTCEFSIGPGGLHQDADELADHIDSSDINAMMSRV